jgi:AraC family transcriptional regulator
MTTSSVILMDPGRFEVRCHRSPRAFHPVDMDQMVQICVPMENALYSVMSRSRGGKCSVHQLGSRDVFVVPPGKSFDVTWRRDADVISFLMSKSFMRKATGLLELKIDDSISIRDAFVSSAAAELCALAKSENIPSVAFVDAIATLVACRVGLRAASCHGLQPERVERALTERQMVLINNYIDERMDCPISLRSLAMLLNISIWHFVRRFTVSQGVPPHTYVTQRRLARAKSLLLESDMSITDVALEIGMTHSHFSRSFRRHFGASPREFRLLQKLDFDVAQNLTKVCNFSQELSEASS